MNDQIISYKQSGVDIDLADRLKMEMADKMKTNDNRVLSRLGMFGALFEASFPGYQKPVLVFKTEEPGSKQKLAFQYNRIPEICHDLIHHLINDIAVMGAVPLSVQDCIICGKMEKDIILTLVSSLAEACRKQNCVLTGGETSEQPGVVEPGIYILTASVVGIADKPKIIDGSAIREKDTVLAVASNGMHTNGYSLIRSLLRRDPRLSERDVDGTSFLNAVMRTHLCYLQPLKALFGNRAVHGIAHITGGGIIGNLNRILPAHLSAVIDLNKIRILPVFKTIRTAGALPDNEMLATFNMGVGLTIAADPQKIKEITAKFEKHDMDCYPIGKIMKGDKKVLYNGTLIWG